MGRRILLAALAIPLTAWVSSAQAQSTGLVDVCTGLGVTLPVLQPVAGVTSNLLAGLLDPVLNGIVGSVNLNLRDALSGKQIGLNIRDQNGNLVTAPGGCKLKADSITVDKPGGIAVGGGEISGLSSTTRPKASAADADAIAFGNGANTSIAATGAVAIGLRGAVTAADGVAIGRDTQVSAAGGIALGAGSVALRGGLAGAVESFSGATVASAQGALSLGSVGNERQITNVAGGTQATDAVNLRQLRAVAGNTVTALGGGASYDAAGTFTGPSYVLGGTTYTNVGAALAALDQGPSGTNGAIATNNTSHYVAAAALGADALGVGYGTSAAGLRSAAIGTQAQAAGANAAAFGASANAAADGSTALGAGANAQSIGGVALGAGSVAARSGLAGGREIFSGATVASVQGAVSVGSAGNERQITNVAGGTQATDAVNLRQLGAVADNAATGLGGGASYDASGNYTGPRYILRGGIYTDVGTALVALDQNAAGTSGAIAANNTSGYAAAAAQGRDALGVGYGSNATGDRSAAVGTQAQASGANATALGAGASASGDGSTAIGAGASATRPRQVAIGTATSTYSLPGLSSSASRAAQSGPTQVVTTDAAGNLGSVPVNIAALDRRVDGLGQRVDGLAAYGRESRREARQGIAAAMAMTGAAMPSRPGRTSWSGNTATFKGEWAAGFAVAHRLDIGIPVALNAGISLSGNSFGGARFGLSGEF